MEYWRFKLNASDDGAVDNSSGTAICTRQFSKLKHTYKSSRQDTAPANK